VYVHCDVSQSDDRKKWQKTGQQRFKAAGYRFFADAGINGVWTPIEELQPKGVDKTIDINQGKFISRFTMLTPHLKAAGGGSIPITSSVNGNRTF